MNATDRFLISYLVPEILTFKGVWDRHYCLDNKIFYSLNCLLMNYLSTKFHLIIINLIISYSRFHNLLIDMQTWRPYKFRRFRRNFDDRPYLGEPLLVPFYTSLNADISRTRKDIKKRPTVFFPVFPVLLYQRIKIFFSYPL